MRVLALCLTFLAALPALGAEHEVVPGRGRLADAIAGAGLDVYVREPMVPERLRALNNAVLLPHLGSATVETRQAMAQMALDNIIAFTEGRRPPQQVN